MQGNIVWLLEGLFPAGVATACAISSITYVI